MPKPSKPRPVQPCAGADSEGLLAEQGRRQLAKNVFQVHGVDAYSPRSSSNANSLWRHALAEPTQVVTESQIHGSHADSQVRVLRGQPRGGSPCTRSVWNLPSHQPGRRPKAGRQPLC